MSDFEERYRGTLAEGLAPAVHLPTWRTPVKSGNIDDNDPTQLMLKLKRPLKNLDGSEIAELHLAEPSARQWIDATKEIGAEADLKLIELVTNLPATVLGTMAASDFSRATRFLSDFARVSLKTGAN